MTHLTINHSTRPQMGLSPLPNHMTLMQALEAEDHKLVQSILASPEVRQISSEGVGQALVLSIEKSFSDYFVQIFALRSTQMIPPNGQWGLGHILAKCVDNLFKEYFKGQGSNLSCLKLIINHPCAPQIELDTDLSCSLGKFLLIKVAQSKKCFHEGDKALVSALLDVRISHLIQPNGRYGLGRVLVNAAHSENVFMVKAVLAHPKAPLMSSQPITQERELTRSEIGLQLTRVGLTEAVFAIVNSKDFQLIKYRDAQNQCLIIQAILHFAMMKEIDLDIHGPFGLARALTDAAAKSELLVPLIWNFPGSAHIVASAPNNRSGGLDRALFNAAACGHSIAIKYIFLHLNATRIPREQLEQARNEAVRQEHRKIAQLISAFLEDLVPTYDVKLRADLTS